MSIFTTMRAGVSVLPPPASRLPTVGEGTSDSFSSLVNGRMPAPEEGPPARLSIYNAMSSFGAFTNGLASNADDVTNGLPSADGKTDDEVSGGPGEPVTNELPLAGSVAGSSDGVSNDLPQVDVPEVASPIGGGGGTATNERPRIQV